MEGTMYQVHDGTLGADGNDDASASVLQSNLRHRPACFLSCSFLTLSAVRS